MVLVEKLTDKAVVWVYAYIGSWEFNAEVLLQILTDLQSYPTILFRMHSYGGDVFEGNLIFNSIIAAPQRMELQIDGVFASMATIISQAFDYVTIVDNGFGMIHAPSGGAYGNATVLENGAKLLRAMEGQFNTVYAQRSGKTEEYTAKWMDGQDHWLTPQELLDEGLVDAIVPSQIAAPEDLTVETVTALGAKAVYTRFAASLESAAKPPQAKQSKMDKKKLIEKYKLQGVTPESTDEQVQDALEKHLDTVTEKADKADNAQETTEQAIEAIVDAAVGPKITAEQKPHFVAVGKASGIKTLTAVLGAIKPHQSITARLGGGGNIEAKTKEGWDWDKYQKEDSKGLENLEKDNPDAFSALFEAKYGKKPALK